MSKSKEKLRALQLRRQGWSIKDIAKELKVSPSSASVWCQSIVLTDTQKNHLKMKQISAGHRGRQMGADRNRKKRLEALVRASVLAREDIQSVTARELYFLGLGIYWGEGVKSRSGQAAIVNSDPRILRVMIRWFQECLSVPKEAFRPYVYIGESHRGREGVIMKYWQKTLGIPGRQFKSPIFLKQKSKQKYENHDSYYGVVALRVTKSTHLKYRILAILEELSKKLE